jgi:hypothetical protein
MAKGQMHSNKAGQEQEEGRRSDLTVQTRLLVRQPIRQEALVLRCSSGVALGRERINSD